MKVVVVLFRSGMSLMEERLTDKITESWAVSKQGAGGADRRSKGRDRKNIGVG